MKPAISSSASIIWEDDDCCIVDKPHGLPSIAQAKGNPESLAGWLREERPECSGVGGEGESGLCHRLDTETSGIILAAKNEATYQALREQFSKHQPTKKYFALVEGICEKGEELKDYLYGRHRGSKKVSVSKKEVPRSNFSSLTYSPKDVVAEENYSLLDINLQTGFRHQIRAQLGSSGFPLIGDSLYGAKTTLADYPSLESQPDITSRVFYLHAHFLSFKHPTSEEWIEMEC